MPLLLSFSVTLGGSGGSEYMSVLALPDIALLLRLAFACSVGVPVEDVVLNTTTDTTTGDVIFYSPTDAVNTINAGLDACATASSRLLSNNNNYDNPPPQAGHIDGHTATLLSPSDVFWGDAAKLSDVVPGGGPRDLTEFSAGSVIAQLYIIVPPPPPPLSPSPGATASVTASTHPGSDNTEAYASELLSTMAIAVSELNSNSSNATSSGVALESGMNTFFTAIAALLNISSSDLGHATVSSPTLLSETSPGVASASPSGHVAVSTPLVLGAVFATVATITLCVASVAVARRRRAAQKKKKGRREPRDLPPSAAVAEVTPRSQAEADAGGVSDRFTLRRIFSGGV